MEIYEMQDDFMFLLYVVLLFSTLPYLALLCPTLPYTGHTCLPLFTLIHLFLPCLFISSCLSRPVHLVLFISSCSSRPVHLVLFISSCSSRPAHRVLHQLARRRTVGNVTVILPRVTHVLLASGITLEPAKVRIA